MNSFLTYLVRGDHTLQLAAHLAAGILSLLLLSGAARPDPATPTTSASTAPTALHHSALIAAATPAGK
jgi:hypothetical protein